MDAEKIKVYNSKSNRSADNELKRTVAYLGAITLCMLVIL